MKRAMCVLTKFLLFASLLRKLRKREGLRASFRTRLCYENLLTKDVKDVRTANMKGIISIITNLHTHAQAYSRQMRKIHYVLM